MARGCTGAVTGLGKMGECCGIVPGGGLDEASSDNTNGGGRIVWVVVSPKAKPAYQSTRLYQHQSTLRLILEGPGGTVFPGAAATAPDMDEFFSP